MIELIVVKDGVEYPVKLPKDLRMITTDYSSVWDWSLAMKSGYSIDLKIPMEGNESIFGWAHLPQIVKRKYNWNVRVIDGGKPEYYGILSIQASTMDVAKDELDCNFVANAIATILIDKTLREVMKNEIVMGSNISELKSYMNSCAYGSWPDYPMTFYPKKASKFYGEDEDGNSLHADWIGICNYFNGGVFELDEPETGTVPPINEEWRYNAVPDLYLLQALKAVFEYAGYRLIGSALENTDLRSVTIFNMKSLDRISGQTARALVDNAQSFTDTPTYILWESALFDTLPISLTLPSTNPKDPTVPGFIYGPFSSKLVLKIGNVSGVVSIYARVSGVDVFVNEFTVFPNSELVTTFLGATNATGLKVSASGGLLEILPGSYWEFGNRSGKANWIRTSVVDGELVPDIPCSEFIQAVKQLGVEFIPNDLYKEVEIRMIADSYTDGDLLKPTITSVKRQLQLKVQQRGLVKWGHDEAELKGLEYLGNVNSYSQLDSVLGFSINGYRYVFSENNYYEYKDLDDGPGTDMGWELRGPRSARLEIGNGSDETEWTMKAKLPKMTTITTPQEMILPLWEDEGGSDFPKLKNDDMPLMFCMVYGLYTGSTENYPFASVTGALYDGSFASGSKAYLVLDEGPNSWWSKYLKPWLGRLCFQEILTVKIMETKEVNSVTLRRSVVMIDGVKYRCKEVKRGLGSEALMEVQLVKLNVA